MRFKTALIAAVLPLGLMLAAHAANVSQTLTAGSVVQVIPQAGPPNLRVYERLVNVGPSGVAWCSRFDPAPAPNKVGSFPLAPFGNALGLPSSEEFTPPGYVPQQPLWCTSDGTTGTGTATITGEVAP